MTGPAARPPLLFVHGAWHAAWCWDEHFTGYFAALGYDVHTVDLRGHHRGAGAARLPWHSIADYVEDVHAVASRLDRPPVLIGHSMGGFVVQKYLEKHDAAGAVLLASVPPRGVIGVTLERLRSRPRDLLRSLTTFTLYPLVAGPERTRELFYSAGLEEAAVTTYGEALGNESYRAFLDMMLLARPRTARIRRRIEGTVPLLVVGGELDRIFPAADVLATAAAYGVEAEFLPGMAHNLMLERGWQQVADRIAGWLEANLSRG
ncbi:MAG: alpha/beta hydrolase [Marmoricola sp.]|nr:alpha/beta hydrolase [Marmoricola sp.]